MRACRCVSVRLYTCAVCVSVCNMCTRDRVRVRRDVRAIRRYYDGDDGAVERCSARGEKPPPPPPSPSYTAASGLRGRGDG